VWFKFTATDTSAKISTCNSDPGRDSLFQVFAAGDASTEEAACSSLTMIACSDDVDDCGGGRHGKICVRNLTPGQTYYVMVASKTPATKSAYQLDIRSPCFDEPIWIAEDCNGNGVPDGCELGSGISADCNQNNLLDECDIASGASFDCDGNSIPDDCVGLLSSPSPLSPESIDGFGFSVALDDPWLVVGTGSYQASPAGDYPLYLFRRIPAGWEEKAKFVAPIPLSYVAVNDGWIVATSPLDSHAYLFRLQGESWSAAGVLEGPPIDPCPRFGVPLAIDGDTIALAKGYCQNSPIVAQESVYVYRRSGEQWTEEARLQNPYGWSGYSFGASVAVRGDHIVVGVPAVRKEADGAAYVFRRTGTTWQFQAELIASESTYGKFFGRSVAIDDIVVVGATRAEDSWRNDTGAVYVFGNDGASWVQQAKLVGPDLSTYALLGWSVQVLGTTVVAGAPFDGDGYGSVHVFRGARGQWHEEAKLGGYGPSGFAGQVAFFGGAVALDGSLLAVGTPPLNLEEASVTGAAYVFQLSSSDCNSNLIPDGCDIRDETSADCNANGLPDECETLPPFDDDFDGDVDLINLAGFQRCFTGPGPATVAACCRMFDSGRDGDVDGADFVGLSRAFAGP
jgi:hypothetical protein